MKIGIKLSKFDLLQEALIGISYVCCWEMFEELWSIDQCLSIHETWNLPMWCYCTLNNDRNQLTVKASKILTLSIRQSKSISCKFRESKLENLGTPTFENFEKKSSYHSGNSFEENLKLSNKEYTKESWEVWNWKLVYYCGVAWQRNKENDGKKNYQQLLILGNLLSVKTWEF